MKRLLTACLVLAAILTASWVSSSEAHWPRRGVTVHVGPRVARGAYYGYGWGYAPRYYGGYYRSYPAYSTTTYYGVAPSYGFYGGPVYGGYYGCGW